MSLFQRFVKEESGATAIEYGLIAALVSIAAIVALTTLGDELESAFSTTASAISSGTAAGTGN